MSKVIVFRTGKEEYAVPLQYVVSIEKIEGLSPIPQMPIYVKGMIEIREQLIPIIDLEYIFYHRILSTDENTRLVIVQIEEITLGILVNEAKEIIEISPEQIKQIGLISGPATDYISGVASLDGRLVTIINPKILIGSLEGINELEDYLHSLQ